jgi:hypothetical protein
MASYKHDEFLKKSCGAAHDELHLAGSAAPYVGVYGCDGCGNDVVAPLGSSLPNADHHRHLNKEGTIRWRLIVFANHASD